VLLNDKRCMVCYKEFKTDDKVITFTIDDIQKGAVVGFNIHESCENRVAYKMERWKGEWP